MKKLGIDTDEIKSFSDLSKGADKLKYKEEQYEKYIKNAKEIIDSTPLNSSERTSRQKLLEHYLNGLDKKPELKTRFLYIIDNIVKNGWNTEDLKRLQIEDIWTIDIDKLELIYVDSTPEV